MATVSSNSARLLTRRRPLQPSDLVLRRHPWRLSLLTARVATVMARDYAGPMSWRIRVDGMYPNHRNGITRHIKRPSYHYVAVTDLSSLGVEILPLLHKSMLDVGVPQYSYAGMTQMLYPMLTRVIVASDCTAKPAPRPPLGAYECTIGRTQQPTLERSTGERNPLLQSGRLLSRLSRRRSLLVRNPERRQRASRTVFSPACTVPAKSKVATLSTTVKVNTGL
ncbi:hypothetical protein GY45DRAFT_669720 [Cubamyces sp. BRFM 1775]|nr:hypothetical protein GY45DRAFT_669720 [Cubamyces sp. BRFM 1775]